MNLIGMLDSPFVRRAAISLDRLGFSFEHTPLSVMMNFEQFQEFNRHVKAPTLVCDDGMPLMESSLIIQFAERSAEKSFLDEGGLMPREPGEYQRALRLIGLGLLIGEKAVQCVYELNLRPAEKKHLPWLKRVSGQLRSALNDLDESLGESSLALNFDPEKFQGEKSESMITQAHITLVSAFTFTQLMMPTSVKATDYPRLSALVNALEQLPVIQRYYPTGTLPLKPVAFD